MSKVNKRQEIIDKAIFLFSKKGFKGTSMRDIARETGLKPASLYSHIESKEAVLMELQKTRFLDKLTTELEKFPPGITPNDKLRRTLIVAMEAMADNQFEWKVIYEELYHFPEGPQKELKKQGDRFKTVLEGFVKEGKRDGVNSKMAVLFLLGAIHHASKWFRREKEFSAREIGEMLASLFCSGCMKTDQK